MMQESIYPCGTRRHGTRETPPPGMNAPGGWGFLMRLWTLLIRNRLILAVASLVWLLWRSGTQPRRLAYPCQQAAAANLGFLSVLFVPALFRRRGRRGATGWYAWTSGSLALAGVLFVLISAGSGVYSEWMGTAAVNEPPPRLANPSPTVVAIVKDWVAPVTDADVEQMVRQAVNLAGGLGGIVKPGDKVVIKPNIVTTGWDGTQGVVTNYRVVWAIIKMVKELGAGEVIIAEGTAAELNGDGERGITWRAFKDAKYDVNGDKKFDYDTSVSLFDLNDSGGRDQHDPSKVTLVTIPNGVIRTQYYVPNILLNCNVLINVPTFKNHYNGVVTLGLKNRVGSAPNDLYHNVPSWNNMKWALVHSTTSGFPLTVAPAVTGGENEIVQRTVVDLNLVRPQDFVVVDGLVGVTNGPVNTPIQNPNPHLRMIIAGRDTVAVDTVGSLAMGYDPKKIPQITWANSTGVLGTMDPGYITVVGDHVKDVRTIFPANYGGAVLCETVAPSFTNLTPAEGETVSSIVPIVGWGFSDNVGVIKAELVVDGVVQDVIRNPSGSFTFEWNTIGIPPGAHQIRVSVYDAALNEASITRNVNVVPPQGPFIWLSTRDLAQAFHAGEVPGADVLSIRNIGTGVLNYTVTADQPWLAGFPISGASAGEEDALPVVYATSTVRPGTHIGHLTVSAPDAPNSPLVVTVTLTVSTVQADFDGDGDVDQSDFGHFQTCLTGAGIVQTDPACATCDLDGDRDVDQNDFGRLQACISGANVFADKNCGD